MAEIVILQPRRRSRQSVAIPVLIEEAPPLGEELAANRVTYAGWVCVLIVFGLATLLWALIGLAAFLWARPI
jgi:hypothetical protein